MAQWQPDHALQRSKTELKAAAKALERMRAAHSFEDFTHEWQAFPNCLEKVWTKTERECRHVKNRFAPWQGRFRKQRTEGPLLRYLHHARNADQHTIEMTAG